MGGCGGGGDAPDATDPLDDDGGRSEAAADASLESAKDRGVKVAPITLDERTVVMEELKGEDQAKDVMNGQLSASTVGSYSNIC